MNRSLSIPVHPGVTYEERPYPRSVGYSRVRLALAGEPIQPPDRIERLLLGQGGPGEAPAHMSLTAHTNLRTGLVVGPGPIQALTAQGEALYFFTFGGQVTSWRSGQAKGYLLASDAPILQPGEDLLAFPSQLFAETQALFALQRARWLTQAQARPSWAVQTDSRRLFAVTVESLLARLERSPVLRQQNQEFYAGLLREKQAAIQAGLWPEGIQPWEAILD